MQRQPALILMRLMRISRCADALYNGTFFYQCRTVKLSVDGPTFVTQQNDPSKTYFWCVNSLRTRAEVFSCHSNPSSYFFPFPSRALDFLPRGPPPTSQSLLSPFGVECKAPLLQPPFQIFTFQPPLFPSC